ncbi:chaperone modulator CbpM [Pedobacter sp. AW1-32]|uniref:chaperone modulator CbpM n=1 Tax=Pedobacter sp. AW1-32 TaxID=3383026 RepID=UPI003FF01877
MENTLISVEDICLHHKIEINFIQSLEDVGLIQTTRVSRSSFIHVDELSKLERYLRLANDLEINIEGLHAVSLLLSQIQEMQNQLSALKNELQYYRQIT